MRIIAPRVAALLFLSAIATACGESAPTSATNTRFRGIADDHTIHFAGIDPVWAGEVTGDRLVYKAADDAEGTAIAISRFHGNGGLGLSGTLDKAPFDMTVTPGACSDGKSGRAFPYTVTLRIGEDRREGCAFVDPPGNAGAARRDQ